MNLISFLNKFIQTANGQPSRKGRFSDLAVAKYLLFVSLHQEQLKGKYDAGFLTFVDWANRCWLTPDWEVRIDPGQSELFWYQTISSQERLLIHAAPITSYTKNNEIHRYFDHLSAEEQKYLFKLVHNFVNNLDCFPGDEANNNYPPPQQFQLQLADIIQKSLMSSGVTKSEKELVDKWARYLVFLSVNQWILLGKINLSCHQFMAIGLAVLDPYWGYIQQTGFDMRDQIILCEYNELGKPDMVFQGKFIHVGTDNHIFRQRWCALPKEMQQMARETARSVLLQIDWPQEVWPEWADYNSWRQLMNEPLLFEIEELSLDQAKQPQLIQSGIGTVWQRVQMTKLTLAILLSCLIFEEELKVSSRSMEINDIALWAASWLQPHWKIEFTGQQILTGDPVLNIYPLSQTGEVDCLLYTGRFSSMFNVENPPMNLIVDLMRSDITDVVQMVINRYNYDATIDRNGRITGESLIMITPNDPYLEEKIRFNDALIQRLLLGWIASS